MPCLCYGSISGDEELDAFVNSEKGQHVMQNLTHAASLIKEHNISIECDLNQIEFRQMFVKCFLHLLVGCDEQGRPRAL
jgi:hypothetical protein